MIINREGFLGDIKKLCKKYDLPVQSGTKDGITNFGIKFYTLKVYGGSVELFKRVSQIEKYSVQLWEDLDTIATHDKCLNDIERIIFFHSNFKKFYNKQF